MNHHSNVAHFLLQVVPLGYQLSIVLGSLSSPLDLFVKFVFGCLLLVNLLGLDFQFLSDYLVVDFVEIVVKIVLDEDKSHCEVVPRVVLDLVFIKQMTHSLR